MIDHSRRINRILTMIPYIQKNPGVRVRELAQFLGVKPEEITADLDVVLLCGVPPYLPNNYISVAVEGDQISVSFAEHFQRPVNLTPQEALSLTLALSRLPLSRAAHETALRLRQKIVDLLPSASRSRLSETRRQVQVGSLPRGVQERVEVLRRALEEHREAHIEYYTASRDELTQRDVRPWAILEHNGEWYLVAYCLLRERELPFRVDRIRRIRLLDRKFDPPKSFDIERYRRPQMYFPTSRDLRVKLRIAPELARWVRDEHPGDKVRELPDGSLILHLSASQPQWVISWVLSHAGKVELLAPQALRNQIAAACAAALRTK